MKKNKFEPGDIVVKKNIGKEYSTYSSFFTPGKEYTLIDGKECDSNPGNVYMLADAGMYIMLDTDYFKISKRTQRNETINDILS